MGKRSRTQHIFMSHHNSMSCVCVCIGLKTEAELFLWICDFSHASTQAACKTKERLNSPKNENVSIQAINSISSPSQLPKPIRMSHHHNSHPLCQQISAQWHKPTLAILSSRRPTKDSGIWKKRQQMDKMLLNANRFCRYISSLAFWGHINFATINMLRACFSIRNITEYSPL